MKILLYTPKTTYSGYIKDGIKEYAKRLSRYCQLKHIEYSSVEQLLQKTDDRSVLITLSTTYDTITSEALAQTIRQIGVAGHSSISFCLIQDEDIPIFSLSDRGITRIPEVTTEFALSKMSLSTEMSLLLLYEQIYRGYRIINNEPYHK